MVRYAESTGKDRNIPYRYAWRYRDYVIDAFNADKPYDRFVLEQLAGDLLPARDAKEKNDRRHRDRLSGPGPEGGAMPRMPSSSPWM